MCHASTGRSKSILAQQQDSRSVPLRPSISLSYPLPCQLSLQKYLSLKILLWKYGSHLVLWYCHIIPSRYFHSTFFCEVYFTKNYFFYLFNGILTYIVCVYMLKFPLKLIWMCSGWIRYDMLPWQQVCNQEASSYTNMYRVHLCWSIMSPLISSTHPTRQVFLYTPSHQPFR